ncbi:MAG: alpha/beta hydrolase [Gemmatimonadaceae bacterium]
MRARRCAGALTTSVLYDRAGTGWSDSVELPRTAADVIAELRALLAVAKVPPPYLLVGHSLGGAYARHYAQRYPGEVASLLLIDPAHEDSSAHYPKEVIEMQEQFNAQPIPDLPLEYLAFWRDVFAEKLARWPTQVRRSLIDYHVRAWRTGMEEARGVEQGLYNELRAGGAMPDVPLIVLTAIGIDSSPTQHMSAELQRVLNDGKRRVNRALAASIPRGEERALPDAVHVWICVEQEDAVVQAIADLLAAG